MVHVVFLLLILRHGLNVDDWPNSVSVDGSRRSSHYHRSTQPFWAIPTYGITLCGQNTSTDLYGDLPGGVRKFFKKTRKVELTIQTGSAGRGLTIQ